jgi:hypothetical protein
VARDVGRIVLWAVDIALNVRLAGDISPTSALMATST